VTPERQIRVIPGKKALEFVQYLPKRACAYVRVSTGHTGQMHSLRNQTEYYERLIKGNPGYVFCGIYSDAGISGSQEDRPGFQAMMEAARRHQVDLILTKSISRFARNAELLLSAVRELKGLGIGVFFEEHRINTLSAEGELLLTVLASFAEEERKSVSTNIQWSIRAGYKKGKPSNGIQRLLGYLKDTDGNIVADPEQAQIVRRIYQQYLAGDTPPHIARTLNAEKVARDIDLPWSGQCILRILCNEHYIGDCLLQKSFVTDTGKQARNKGQLDRYYVQNHHPAIIDREVWDAAQRLREERRTMRYSFSSLLRCAFCGASLIRTAHEKRWVSWICATYLHHGKAACIGTRVPEHIVQAFHAANPIIEPMVVQEAGSDKRNRTRTLEHYHFSPISKSRCPGR